MKKISLSIVFLLACVIGSAQEKKIRNLVFEGGGVRGFAYVGAMEILDSLHILENIERVGGTSAGAIEATMIAIGYTPAEILGAIKNIPLKDFNDGRLTGGISRIRRKFGFYKGQKLTEWVTQLIAAKTGNADITFLELHELVQQKGYKDLYITGTDLSHRCLRIFSHETYPSMRIRDALRISFSIPLYFEPLWITDSGRVETDKTKPNLHLMVDGGLLSNYPVQIFDNAKYMNCDSIPGYCRNMETLGLLLEKPGQLSYSSGAVNTALPITTLNEYISAVYKTAFDKPNPDEEGAKRTIAISDLGLRGKVRKLPEATIQQLVESGRNAVRIFFSQR